MLNDPSRPNLEEKKDILRFFKCHPHLSAFIGRFSVNTVDYKNIRVCHEFNLFGDHVADLAVGNATANEYCFIEFENATMTSIFKAVLLGTEEVLGRRCDRFLFTDLKWDEHRRHQVFSLDQATAIPLRILTYQNVIA